MIMKPRILLPILALGAAAACQQALDLDEFSFAETPRGVLWLGLAAAPGQTCSWPRSYQLPDQAQETITSTTGDRSYPGISCTGAGGLLFERCSE
jgi:hypothetical protein